MKQIDYLKLVATGRKSIYYARPSDADDALTGLVGICFVISLALIFAIAVLASYLGEPMSADMLGWPLAATVLLGIAYFVCSIYISDTPKLTRYFMIVIGAGSVIFLAYTTTTGGLIGWYLFIPPFLFALLVSLAAVKQL